MTPLLQRAGDAMRSVVPGRRRADSRQGNTPGAGTGLDGPARTELVDLARRRDQLAARVAELQWDLGGLAYEMAVRDSIRVDVIVRKAAELQNVDAELNEIERILRLEETSTAGECPNCHAPHSTGAVYCWQCGHTLLQQVQSDAITSPPAVNGAASRTGP